MKYRYSINDILRWSSDYLNNNRISASRLEAEILICYVLNYSKTDLYTNLYSFLNIYQLYKIKSLINKRIKNTPIAYLTGEKEFYGLKFYINKNVLIPRPETELLINVMLQFDLDNKDILDIGTGSGNIGITIRHIRKKARVTCSDISLKALKAAKKNSYNLLGDGSIRFIQSDIFASIPFTYDFIISNPPYILTEELNELDSQIIDYEPLIALDGGADGMQYYNRIIKDCRNYLNKGGYLLLEISPSVKNEILLLLKKYGLQMIKIIKDYNKLDRIIIAKYEN